MKYNPDTKLLCLVASAAMLAGPSCRSHCTTKTDKSCESNLTAIVELAENSIPSGYDYPPDFADLIRRTSTTNNWLFVCPATGHLPGKMDDVDQWTDYIYVGRLFCALMDSRVPMVICPAEHHGRGFGYVAFVGGDVHKMTTADIQRLIQQPWWLATKLPAHQKEYLEKQVTVQVPKRLRSRYPNAYKPELNEPPQQ